jgi:hypothetical protein
MKKIIVLGGGSAGWITSLLVRELYVVKPSWTKLALI